MMAHDHSHAPPANLALAFRWAVGPITAYMLIEAAVGWAAAGIDRTVAQPYKQE